MSPPGPLRWGSTTWRRKAPATAASKALPPRSSTACEAALASQCVEAAMPKCPSRVGRVVKAAGGVNGMAASFGNGVSGSLMQEFRAGVFVGLTRELSVGFDCTRAPAILRSLQTNYSFTTVLYTKLFFVFWTARRAALVACRSRARHRRAFPPREREP